MHAPIQLITFDLDGTLVDSVGEIAEGVNAALARHGLPAATVGEVRDRVGNGMRRLVQELLARPGGPSLDEAQVDAVVADARAAYARIAGTGFQLYAGARQLPQALKARGIRTACVTNKDAAPAASLLRAAGLLDGFDLVVGGDTLPWRKPDGRVLQHVVATLGCDPAHAVHVGDSIADVQAARNAGVRVWAVTHGYNHGAPIAASGPDVLLDDLDDVLACVDATAG